MNTEVRMVRSVFGQEIMQKSKSEFFSLTDLVKAGYVYRTSLAMQPFDMSAYYKKESTKEFIARLEEKYGCVKISAKGRGHHTWVHPYLFIDVALSISPDLKLEVYDWLFDSLIEMRNSSGDSYKKMTGALYELCTNKALFAKTIVRVCDKIMTACCVTDWNKASSEQLKKRNDIHNMIFISSDFIRDIDKCVDYSILKANNIREVVCDIH